MIMTIEEEWMSRNGLKYNDSGISIKEETPISVIKWQKGEPKENGSYLVSIKGNISEYTTCAIYNIVTGWCHWKKEKITAWCKLSDIEPYKEEKQ